MEEYFPKWNSFRITTVYPMYIPIQQNDQRDDVDESIHYTMLDVSAMFDENIDRDMFDSMIEWFQ